MKMYVCSYHGGSFAVKANNRSEAIMLGAAVCLKLSAVMTSVLPLDEVFSNLN